jgi:DUF1365 family protein
VSATPPGAAPAPVPALVPALYDCVITHTRTTPLRNRFRYRSYLWLVDVDALPRPRRPFGSLASFRTRDHLAGGPKSIRQNLDAVLAGHGVDPPGGRVLMLTAARVLGHVFNPVTVYWCHAADGRLTTVVAEVHNTYGGRHCYLVRTGERGRARTEKDFYVSPFEPATGGSYTLSLPEPADRLDLTITLHRPGAAPFVAGVRGDRRPAGTAGLLRMFLRHPVAPLMVAVRIRRQGIGLWLRGLPVVPRPGRDSRPAKPPKPAKPVEPWETPEPTGTEPERVHGQEEVPR